MVEAIHRYQRVIVVTAFTSVIVAAWLYTLFGVGMGDSSIDMTLMALRFDDMAMARPVWTASYAVAVFLMWWVMMVAMMLPSAMPMMLLYSAVVQRRVGQNSPYISIAVFGAGYLAAWSVFSLAAAAANAVLDGSALLSPMMDSASSWLSGGLFVAAGAYQLSHLKDACLSHCRSPLSFLMRHWRPSIAGTFRMGVTHGLYCLGCCWVLMALLFIGGVMNLFWIGAIALYVLIEKTVPRGHAIGRCMGIALMAAGIFIVVQAS